MHPTYCEEAGLTLLWTLTLGCGQLEECGGYGEPQAMGTVGGELEEASGLAVSRQQENLVWSHNDKGDSARVFALGLNAAERGTFLLTGVSVTDLEDIAVGPDGRLWIGDIGDNDNGRDSVSLFVAEEPSDPDAGGALSATEHKLEYEHVATDAEALFVDEDGTAWVIDKVAAGKARLYRADLDAGLLVEEHAWKLPVSGNAEVTAADLSPDGSTLALRTKEELLLYARASGQSWPEVLEGTPCTAPVADERQGEAIGMASWGYLTLSEGSDSTLFRYNRAD